MFAARTLIYEPYYCPENNFLFLFNQKHIVQKWECFYKFSKTQFALNILTFCFQLRQKYVELKRISFDQNFERNCWIGQLNSVKRCGVSMHHESSGLCMICIVNQILKLDN